MIIATLIALLALFSLLSILLGSDDGRHRTYPPKDDFPIWLWYGRR